jgi:hypothetical protein
MCCTTIISRDRDGATWFLTAVVTRWQELTGKKAVLESDGRAFEQVAEERKPTLEVQPCPEKS